MKSVTALILFGAMSTTAYAQADTSAPTIAELEAQAEATQQAANEAARELEDARARLAEEIAATRERLAQLEAEQQVAEAGGAIQPETESKPEENTQNNRQAPEEPQNVREAVTEGVRSALAKAEADAQQRFGGVEFGVGISLTLDMGDNVRVERAEVVDGIVRVLEDQDDIARLMLESHYFFTPDISFFGLVDPNNWGIGPFIAIQPGEGDVIDAVALGGMIGFRRPGNSTQSFNLGIGWIVDPDAQILGDGFVDGMSPPGNETVVRFRETSQHGVVIMTSFAF